MKSSIRAIMLFLTVPIVCSFLLPSPSPSPSPNLSLQLQAASSAAKTAKVKPLDPTAPAPLLSQNPPMKIALLVEPTPFNYVSGYSNRYNEMLRYIKQAGDDVSILTTDDRPSPPTSAFGYPIATTLGFRFPLYNHVCVTFDLPELKGLRLMEKFRPDIIHISSPGFLLFAALIYARVMRVPLIMSYHTHLPHYAKEYLGYIPRIEDFAWFLVKFAHTRADLTLTTSPQIKKEMEGRGIKRIDVWRKGIDTVRFDPKFKSVSTRKMMTDDNPSDFTLVYVGRLGAEKRVMDIKPILEKLGPKTRLCIVGDGPQASELRREFKGTNTVFTGQITGDSLSSAFASADAFVMPSDSETLGFVVLESMASGVPVVACNAGGIPSIIEHGKTSYLAEPGDTDEFVKYLEILRDDKEKYEDMKRECRKEAEKFSWEAATSVLRNVQYPIAMQNFRSRSFGGYGGVRTAFLGRVWRIKFAWLVKKVKRLVTLGFFRDWWYSGEEEKPKELGQ
ncbi:hypothetical protein TrST_g9322 [Triparma strigata]|uniref:Uncharacterized protein n=1 Tax=Triparma strigata TaxID=1606541 RepID=A0A9W7C7H2_9STRA|nr:hypothetical protein TrST_g9322 [Triparma strigata]